MVPVCALRVFGWLSVGVLIALSVVPGQHRPQSTLSGEFEHLIAYAVSSGVLGLGYHRAAERLKILFFLVVLAGCLEITQIWVPGRRSEIIGFAASSTGAALGMLCAALHPFGLNLPSTSDKDSHQNENE